MSVLSRIGRRWAVRRLNRKMDVAVRHAAGAGWNPVSGIKALIEAECGFPPAPHETVNEYIARAAGVSVETVERFHAAMSAGERTDMGALAPVNALVERIGRRIAG